MIRLLSYRHYTTPKESNFLRLDFLFDMLFNVIIIYLCKLIFDFLKYLCKLNITKKSNLLMNMILSYINILPDSSYSFLNSLPPLANHQMMDIQV